MTTKIDTPCFRFYHEGQRKSYVFTLKWTGYPLDHDDFFYDKIQPLIEKLELETRYGIHDFDTRGENMWWGFTSYEVPGRQMKALMAEWQEIFKSLGFETGNLEVIKGDVEG